MQSLQDFTKNYPFLKIIKENELDFFRDSISDLIDEQISGDPNFIHPLNIGDYLLKDRKKDIYIVLKNDRDEFSGIAILSFQRVIINKSIKQVCFISDFLADDKNDLKLKRNWQNTFIDLINNLENIIEFKNCKYIHSLVLNDYIPQNIFPSRLSRSLEISQVDEYKIYNIFTKSYKINNFNSKKVKLAGLNDIDRIRLYIAHQKANRHKDLNIFLCKEEITRSIESNSTYIIEDDNNIKAIFICENISIAKKNIHKLDNRFKLSDSFLPLFGKGPENSHNNWVTQSDLTKTYVKLIEINKDLNIRDRKIICKNIIEFLITDRNFKNTSLITLMAPHDYVLDKTMKNFLAIESNISELIFERKKMALQDIELGPENQRTA